MLCSCNNQVQFNEHVIIKQKVEAFKFLSKYHHQLHIMIGEESLDGSVIEFTEETQIVLNGIPELANTYKKNNGG